ncbi:MAG: PAS domain-containing protein [Myxococcales bacterium]|nr:PAS domain-containing protein [Myxococcales bacterium]
MTTPRYFNEEACFLFDRIPDLTWIYDRETLRFLDANPAAIEKLGYPREELLQKTIADLRYEEDIPALWKAVRAIKDDETYGGIWKIRTKKEDFFYAEFRWRVLDPEKKAILASVRDVTLQVRAKQEKTALLEEQSRLKREAEAAANYFRGLFEAIPGKFAVLQPDTHQIISANDGYLQSTMTRREDIVGRNIFDIFPISKELPAGSTDDLHRSLRRVESTGETDVMSIHRYPIPRPPSLGGGLEERFWSLINTPVKDNQGQVTFIIHCIEDITDYILEGKEDLSEEALKSHLTSVHKEILLHSKELKDTNYRLQEQDAYWRTTERLMNIGLWKYNIDTDGLEWLSNVHQLYGRPPDEKIIKFEDYLQLVHPDDRRIVVHDIQKFVQSPTQYMSFQHRVLAVDGRIIHIKGLGELTQTPKGRILTGVVQDTTQEILAKSKFEEISQRLYQTLHHMDEAFCLFDHDARFEYINEKASQIFGKTSEELAGISIKEAYPHEMTDKFVQDFVHAIEKQETIQQTRYFADSDRWYQINIHPVSAGIAVYFRNVSERKRTEQAARISEERFQIVAKATSDVIWDWDLVQNLVWWSKGMFHLFGYRREELEPDATSWSNRIHPDDVERVLSSIHDVIDGTETLWEEQYRFLHADGTTRYIQDRGFVIRGDAGQAIRMVGGMVDITEQRELTERLHQAQKLETIGQLTGGIAHDFNNLLTVILGNAELLKEELVGQQDLYPFAEMTATAALRGADLTHRLLAFARRQALAPKQLDVNHHLIEMENLLRRILHENIEIKTVLAPDIWITEVDPTQLESAILNLAVNARDAMPSGGKLTIETSNVVLGEKYASEHQEVSPGEYVQISVSDSGVGMPPKVAAQVFEPFFTTKPTGKGSGLGLSMVYGFVKQSEGHVKLYSEVGEGTSIKLYFPRCRKSPKREPAMLEISYIQGGSEHILLVEDEAMVRQYATSVLQGLGYRVTTAESGDQALELLKQNEDIDLLFTDVIMPGSLNGRQLAEQAHLLRPTLKILYTSGYTENAIVHHGRLDEGVQLLNKPYHRQELISKIRSVLDE